ncbi:hypothetical protein ACFQ0P_13910 [Microbacterium insulae]|uniref:DUF222 domain-containing protein n=1 Tax=Microbacterium insulae TaxID=483014 RepID=A0ABW3AML2_9MICO
MSDGPMNPAVLTRALERLGWHTVGGFRDTLAYWEPVGREHTRSERIAFPLAPDAPDYADLLGDVAVRMHTLYGSEFAEVLSLASMLVERQFDEVDVKRHIDNRAGLIKWLSGNEMVDSTQGILAAAAKSSNLTRKRFAQAQSVIAEDFLSQCYMGQTKISSYVITALTPSAQTFATSKAVDAGSKKHPRISGREITARLVTSLQAVRDALDETPASADTFEAFDERVIAGVSFELLASLQPLTSGDESAISVEFNSNDQHTLMPGEPRNIEFAFTPEDGAKIGRARAYFEQTPEPTLMSIVGEITGLKNSESDPEHRITLSTRVNGKPRTVTVHLSDEQYDEALRAHGAKRMFSVVGELEERTRGSVIAQAERVHTEETSVSTPLTDYPTTPLF